MRDHRPGVDNMKATDITELVRSHARKHPGSVQRSPSAQKRAAAKRAAQSRKVNRR